MREFVMAHVCKRYVYMLTASGLMTAYFIDGHYIHGILVLTLAFMEEGEK